MWKWLLSVLTLAASLGSASADGYTKWVNDPVKKTYSCQYVYANKSTANSTQNVVVYYGDKERKNWAYYYNAKMEPWARCAVPGNPKYDAKAMTWEALKPDTSGYAPFKDKAGDPEPAGFCPAPKDGKAVIAALPLPPV